MEHGPATASPGDTVAQPPTVAHRPSRGSGSAPDGIPVVLCGLATAVPPYQLAQDDVEDLAAGLFAAQGRAALFERLRPAYRNAGIETRHSCVPLSWYQRPAGWRERSDLYVDSAMALLSRAGRTALDRAGRTAAEVDAIVCVSTTGIATPSLDARLVAVLGLRHDVIRLPIFGLGCAGGVLGLARATALARGLGAGTTVLVLVVELCALTFRAADVSRSNLIATALFGDGAAAAVLTAGQAWAVTDAPAGTARPRIGVSGEWTWPGTLDVMGWTVEEDGLGVVFAQDIPNLIRLRLGAAAAAFLDRHGLSLADIGRFICHPGGTRVVAALEETFSLPTGALDDARAILRRFGNMSAATVLFVLEQALVAGSAPEPGCPWLLTALGPGFSAGFLALEAE